MCMAGFRQYCFCPSRNQSISIRHSIAIRVKQLVVLCSTNLCLQLGRIQTASAAFRKAARLTRSPQSHSTNASRAFARNVTVCRRSSVRQHVPVEHSHRDIHLRHPWWPDCAEDVKVPIVQGQNLHVESFHWRRSSILAENHVHRFSA